jgi:hypothetical protein
MVHHDPDALELYDQISSIFEKDEKMNSKSLASMRIILEIYERDWKGKAISDNTMDRIIFRTTSKFEKLEHFREVFLSKLPRRSPPFDMCSLMFFSRSQIDYKWFSDTFLGEAYKSTSIRSLGSGYFCITMSDVEDAKKLLSFVASTHPMNHKQEWSNITDESVARWAQVDARYHLPNHESLHAADKWLFVRIATMLDRVSQYPIAHETIDISQDFVNLLLAHLMQRHNQHVNEDHTLQSIPDSHADLTFVHHESSPQRLKHTREDTHDERRTKRKREYSSEWDAYSRTDNEKLLAASADLPKE